MREMGGLDGLLGREFTSKRFSSFPIGEPPEPKFVTCVECKTEFKSSSYWLGYRWWYANICDACNDKMDEVDRNRPDAPISTFRCLKCKKLLTQKALWKNGAWFYDIKCPECGTVQSCYSKPIKFEDPPKKKPRKPYKDED